MKYDFFTLQPVHGARVYFMHMIMHAIAADHDRIRPDDDGASFRHGALGEAVVFLLPRAGLEIVRIWSHASGEGIIEAMVPTLTTETGESRAAG